MSFARLKSLGKDSLIYGVSGIISRMITFFLVPLYTRVFQPADYGVLNLINTTMFLFGMFSICAMDNATARWYYDTTNETERKRTFASWFWFQFVLTSVLVVVLLAATSLASRYLLNLPTGKTLVPWTLAVCTLLSNILPTVIWNWLRLRQRPMATIVFTLSQSLVTILLTVLFVVVLHWGIVGVYAALLIASSVFSGIALYMIGRWLAPALFSKARLKEMLRFALPLIPASIAFWLLNSTNAYFIQAFRGKAEVGLFSIGAALASGVTLITGSFQQAWGPFAFSIADQADAKATYANVFTAFGALCAFLVLGMFLFSPEVLQLVTTPDYYPAAWVASILSLNVVLIALTYIASIGPSIAKNTMHYSVGVLMGTALTLALNFALIPLMGKEGSAIATVSGQLVVACYLFFRSQQLYPIPYRFIPIVLCLVVAIAAGWLGRSLHFGGIATQLAAKGMILAIFAAGIFLLFVRKPLQTFLRSRALKNEIVPS